MPNTVYTEYETHRNCVQFGWIQDVLLITYTITILLKYKKKKQSIRFGPMNTWLVAFWYRTQFSKRKNTKSYGYFKMTDRTHKEAHEKKKQKKWIFNQYLWAAIISPRNLFGERVFQSAQMLSFDKSYKTFVSVLYKSTACSQIFLTNFLTPVPYKGIIS